ncbi:MAG: hypothetical protein RLZZ399_2707, partial [Verrucomicrobiota bacterium]
MTSRSLRLIFLLTFALVLCLGGAWTVWMRSKNPQQAAAPKNEEGRVAHAQPEEAPASSASSAPVAAAGFVASEPASVPPQAKPQKAADHDHEHAGEHGDFDKRGTRGWEISASQKAALEALQSRIPGVNVQFDALSGAANHVMAPGRFLTGPSAAGEDPYATLRRFVEENAALFGHDAEALSRAVRVTREDVSAHNGMRSVVWQQEVDGVPVYNTILRASLTKTGELVTVGSHFVSEAEKATQLAAQERAALVQQPPVDFGKAVALAAANVESAVDAALVRAASPSEGAERRQRVEAPGLSDVSAGLAWLPMSQDNLALVWDVTLMSLKEREMFRLVVDAKSGDVLVRTSLTNDLSDASYRVHANETTRKPLDSPRPFSPGYSTPNGAQPPVFPRKLITLSALDYGASPAGWIADGGTRTFGNNVDAHLDLTNTNPTWGLGTNAISATRVFDFPMDLAQPASTYRDAAVTTLFYLCNWYHDKLYNLGFTETAGNFQQSNFGRGGRGNDAVLADAQDGGGTNNANFSTPSDGLPGRMQMYLWSRTNPGRDGSLDAEVVIHEYTHGLSNRLVGGGVGMSALQSRGMGEGWSDFYALALLGEPGDDANGNYALGAYLSGNYYKGVRTYPYTTDMVKNPLTLSRIEKSSLVHFMGEVWCVALWEVRANLIAKHGWEAGNEMTLQLVTDGMKLSPVNPTFLQARDAIVQADLVNHGGANRWELWRGFAKRGMGASAIVPASSATTGVTEAFDVPDALIISPADALAFENPQSGVVTPAFRVINVTNSSISELVSWTVGASESWISVSPAGGVLAPGATAAVSVTVRPGATPAIPGVHAGKLNFRNVSSGKEFSRELILRVGNVDFFTELFSGSSNDTAFQSWTFTPDSSVNFYSVQRASISQFPSDPAGGTSLALFSGGSVWVTPPPAQKVKFFGTSYSSFCVSTSGYITFGLSDSESAPSLNAHFSKARISGLFANLDPAAGGSVSWKQWADRIAVTYLRVPEFDINFYLSRPTTGKLNSFQIELFFDGRLRISCLEMGSSGGLIGLSRGTGVPTGFLQSDFSRYGVPVELVPSLALQMPSPVLEGSGLLLGQGSVSRSVASATDVVVSLASSLPSKVQVPSVVTIRAGELRATFDVNVLDDAALDGVQWVVASANAPGFSGAAGVVLVQDNEPPATLSLAVPAEVTEGAASASGVVSISRVADAPMSVSLRSTAPGELWVPVSVVIPVGQSSVSFPLRAVDDNRIDGTQSAVVTARVEGWTDASAAVSVLDNETRNLTVNLPASLSEGLSSSGSVSISGVLPAPLVVSLVSSNPSRLTVPASVTIPANATSVSFSISAPNNSLNDGSAAVSVSAIASEFVGGDRLMTVWDDEVHHFEFAPVGVTQVRGVPFAVTVTAKDINNVTVPRFTGSLPLSAVANGGSLAVSPSVVGPFASGVWKGNVTVNGFDSSVVLRVANASGREGISNPFSVGSGVLDHFGWSISGGTQFSGHGFPARIVAQDVANNTVSTFSGSTALKIPEPTRTIGTGSLGSTGLLDGLRHDHRSQCIYLQSEVGAAGTIRSLSLNVAWLPKPLTLNAWTIRLRHTDLQGYGSAPEWESAGWTTVYQSNEALTGTGWVTFRFTTPFEYDGVRNLMVDFSLINNSSPYNASVWGSSTAQSRRIYQTTTGEFGDPLAWAGMRPNPLADKWVPNVQLGFERALQVVPTSTGNFSNGVWDGVITVRGVGTDAVLVADDGSGHQGQSVAFNIAALAPTVGSVAVSGVGTTSATLSGLVNPKGTPTSAAFEVGPTSSYGVSLPVTLTPADGIEPQSVSVVLNGLNPGTEYHARLVGKNLGGSSMGEDVTFRTVSTNADLTGLALSGGILSPGFASGVTSYVASVPYATSGVSVTPVVADATASVKVNGVTVASGSASAPLALVVGLNPVVVEVTAQDGVTVKTYTVGVTRLPSTNADLAGLALSGGILSSGFASGVTSYAVSVPNETSAWSVTPVVADATASVKVNGVSVASGSASVPLALVVGLNPVVVEVTAQDGLTVKTYTVGVTRLPSTNADLTGLVVSGGTLSPGFASGVTSYAVSVPHATSGVSVTPVVADATASVKVNGVSVASGSASVPVALSVGLNPVVVEVTAQDGVTVKTYTVGVTRLPSTNADLAGLVVSGGTLSPGFASGVTSYAVSVPNEMSAWSVTPVVADATASVK